MADFRGIGECTITKEEYDRLAPRRPITWGPMHRRRGPVEPETNTVDLTLMVESFLDGAE